MIEFPTFIKRNQKSKIEAEKIEVHELPYTEIVKSATITVDSPI